MLHTVVIDKLVHGGQGLGMLPDGRKVFVWNALPAETVGVRLVKNKRNYAEGIAEEIMTASPERRKPRDEAYLSTSPWQILAFEAENSYKRDILQETFARENIAVPSIEFIAGKKQWHYRNKMEYSFWADNDGLHLALFNRGTHGKRIVTGSSIARPEIDDTATEICAVLNRHGIRGSQLKTIVLRCSQKGETVAALFVKDAEFKEIPELSKTCQGITVCLSDPKSPASVLTSELYTYGDTTLTDTVMNVPVSYDVHSFFQVNLPVFERVAKRIDYFTGGGNPKTDFYSGVGTIGLAVNATTLVENDPHNVVLAKRNVDWRPIEVIQASAESALEHIPATGALIVDPPRAGLHTKVIARILDQRPATVVYLSCNPSTQARDLKLLATAYDITCMEGYNFFPRTPHIESLAILAVHKP